jgi:hypothetical protein
MAKLNANPEVEANVTFDVIKPGEYTMRVEEITEFVSQNSGNTCWKTKLSFAAGQDFVKLDGTPAKNVGVIFDNSLVVAPADKQGKLRSFVEALGRNWEDMESEELIGLECIVKVGLEEYKGEQKNVAKRYLAN